MKNISLKKHILGAVPSKLYEVMSSETPIIFIGDGEAKNIVESSKCGLTLPPYDTVGIAKSIKKIITNVNSREFYGKNGRAKVLMEYNRKNILKAFGLSVIANNYQSFSKGQDREIIEIKRDDFSLKILPLICYEIIYSGKIFQNQSFDLMVNISEDGWFGRSIGPKQHFAHSIFRSVESGKYLLRSANNGIAAIVNPLGIVEQKVEHGDSGYIDFKKAKKIQPTLFSKYGNKIFITLILLYIFLIFSFNRFRDE